MLQIVRGVFLFFMLVSSPALGTDQGILKTLDIDIIAPSSGVDVSTWNKIFELTGKKCEMSTGSSDSQAFEDQNLKFRKLDSSLRSDHKILWAVRGGYGVDKLMKRVSDSDYSKEKKKVIIGYSDITPLMIHMSQKYGWVAISAPMLRDFVLKNKSPKSYSEVLKLLSLKSESVTYSDLKPLNQKAKNVTQVLGKITGGNLTCIVSTIGTPWQIQTGNKILLIEDIDVRGYSLDRLLTHLQNSELLKGVRAVVFGDFGEKEADNMKSLKAFAEQLDVPVFKSGSFGHGKSNIPFGYEFNGLIAGGQLRISAR